MERGSGRGEREGGIEREKVRGMGEWGERAMGEREREGEIGTYERVR